MLDETRPGPLSSSGSAPGVRVYVRLRPTSEESDIEIFDTSKSHTGTLTIKDPLSAGRSEHSYEFSGIFAPEQKQDDVFSPVAGAVVDAAIQGHSGCVMAYGQTGSGKTYSIFGEGGGGANRGLLPRAVERVFERWPRLQKNVPKESISVSFLEVYLDKVRDLGRLSDFYSDDVFDDGDATQSFASKPGRSRSHDTNKANIPVSTSSSFQRGRSPGVGNENLQIREGPSGPHVRGLEKLPAQSLADVQRIIDRGLSRRAIGKTAANVQSSRSHTVFTVYLPRHSDSDAPQTEALEVAALSFVDLAGSERLAKSKAEGIRFQEAVSINSSLTALGKVILALAADPASTRHIPHRDSKLTRLLSPSLSGDAKVALLATIHPRVEDYEESLNTLSFADRCKNVIRQPQVNYISAKKHAAAQIAELQAEIVRLKEELSKAQTATVSMISDCGVSGIGSSGKVDDVDVAIAKVLMTEGSDVTKLAADTSSKVSEKAQNESNASTTSQTAVAVTAKPKKARQSPLDVKNQIRARAVEALTELQEERGRQQEAFVRAEERIQALEDEKRHLRRKEEQHMNDIAELHHQGERLEQQRTKVDDEWKALIASSREEHAQVLNDFKKEAERQVGAADAALLRLPAQLKKLLEIETRKKEDAQAYAEEEQEKHLDRIRLLKQGHVKEFKELQTKRQSCLSEVEDANRKLQGELQELQKEQRQVQMQCQSELLSLFEIITKQAKLIADVEDGKHPVIRRAGYKEVVLPENSRPALPSAQTHHQLFHAIVQEAKGQEDKAQDGKSYAQDRSYQYPLPSGRRFRAGSGGVAAVAAAEAMRGITQETKTCDDKSPEGMRLVTAQKPQRRNQDTVDVVNVCKMLCEVEGEEQAEAIVADLPADYLQRFCLELRSVALGRHDQNEERETLRRLCVSELQDEATESYLKELELRRSAERAALVEAVERGRELRNWLGSRKSSLASLAAAPLQVTSGSRSISRTMTPIGGRSQPESRCSTRPGTATQSRPPMVPTHVPSVC